MPSIPKELNIARDDRTADVLNNSTLNGVRRSKTSIIQNLHVIFLNGDIPIALACAQICNIPDVIRDVPIPQEVQSIPGLSHLARKFPTKKDWATLMLIGRDCIQVKSHVQCVSSEDNHQLAIQTPLE